MKRRPERSGVPAALSSLDCSNLVGADEEGAGSDQADVLRTCPSGPFSIAPAVAGALWLVHAFSAITGNRAYGWARWVLLAGLPLLAVAMAETAWWGSHSH